jgi:hypothetical protein
MTCKVVECTLIIVRVWILQSNPSTSTQASCVAQCKHPLSTARSLRPDTDYNKNQCVCPDKETQSYSVTLIRSSKNDENAVGKYTITR